jgi:hypothetical protein
MKKVNLAIITSTVYLAFFQAAIFLGLNDSVIFGLLLVSPVIIFSLVYVILKHGKPSPYTFEERFYDDFDYIRNNKKI